ncbi:unnamed protein product [Notodromas monacha]|uniref:Uncharacterized protein n=1 Tax=Notodromas monacha TaxID=399045 RepID=A0A7R9G928_9CRUS|nr:unnamed protein product [Notodromas monacha]CAG0913880.1 unnamed protein product [Notodromas monacha]
MSPGTCNFHREGTEERARSTSGVDVQDELEKPNELSTRGPEEENAETEEFEYYDEEDPQENGNDPSDEENEKEARNDENLPNIDLLVRDAEKFKTWASDKISPWVSEQASSQTPDLVFTPVDYDWQKMASRHPIASAALQPHHDSKSTPEYIKESKMTTVGTWASDTEILAASTLLRTTIFIYAKEGRNMKWFKFPANALMRNIVPNEKSIYLCHTAGCHYDYVTAVANANSNSTSYKSKSNKN